MLSQLRLDPANHDPSDRARPLYRLSHQDEAYVRAGLQLQPVLRVLWSLAVLNWKAPTYGELSAPLPAVAALLARHALATLAAEIQRQLGNPKLNEDDEVELMNDLHAIQITQATAFGIETAKAFQPATHH